MGGGSWNSDAYREAKGARKAKGEADFGYTAKVERGEAPKAAHESLDPKKAVAGASSVLAGQVVRESRDIDGKESFPIIVLFDVTGSMRLMPTWFQANMTKLMDALKERGKVEHPQICFGAIGDHQCDTAPFQVSQFEADNRCDEHLRNLFLEGGGGGDMSESYEIGFYFAANRTATDAWDKRGKKGLMITIGDEGFHHSLPASVIRGIFGVEEPHDEKSEDLIHKALERWNCFHLSIKQGTNYHEREQDRWRAVLGERVIQVDDYTTVVEKIAAIALMVEGGLDVKDAVAATGLTGAAAKTVENELSRVAGVSGLSHVAAGGLPAGHGSTAGGVSRA